MLLSHLAKYRSLMPSLAVILHLIDRVDAGVGGPVSGVAAERAATWCRYLERHARRLYATVTDRVRVAAALLASRIARGRLASLAMALSRRDLHDPVSGKNMLGRVAARFH